MSSDEPMKVVTYEPVNIKIIRDIGSYELIKQDQNRVILKILTNTNLTVREIQSEYEKETGETRSTKSIYRYLSELKDAGLVSVSGRLIVPGKTATENLFTRTAAIFYSHGVKSEKWLKDNSQKIAEGVGFLFSAAFGDTFSSTCLKKLLFDINQHISMDLEAIFNSINEEQFQHIQSNPVEIIELMIEYSTIFNFLLKRPEYINELRYCYEK